MHRLKRVPFFASLSDEELTGIYGKMHSRHFPEGEFIFREGDQADALFLIEQGMVKVVSDSATEAEVFAHLSEGDFFGEMALLSNRPRASAIRAVSPVDVLVLRKNDFEDQLRLHPTLALTLSRTLSQRLIRTDHQLVERHLRMMTLFADLSDEDILAISHRLQPKQYKKGWLVFQNGEPASSLYLIERGQVKVVSDAETERETIAVLGEGGFFGEMALLTGEPRTAAVRAATDVDLWTLSKTDFEEILVAYPPIGLALSRVLGQRLEQTDMHLVQHSAETRRPAAAPRLSRPSLPALPSLPSLPAIPRPAIGHSLTIIPVLQEALEPLEGWFRGLTFGRQLRFAALGLLAVWVGGISLPMAVLGALADSAPAANPSMINASAASGVPGPAFTFNPFGMYDTPTPAPTPTNPPTWTPTAKPATPTPAPVAAAAAAPMAAPMAAAAAVAEPTATPVPPTLTPTPTRVPPTNTPAPPTATRVPPTNTPVPPPPVSWDGRLSFLRIGHERAAVAPGQTYWALVDAKFQNSDECGGSHHIFVDLRDEAGNRVGLPEGAVVGQVNSDALNWGMKPANEYPVNYAMYGGLGAYSAWVTLGGIPSDKVTGMGMVEADGISAPLLASPGKIHVTYLLTFQRRVR